MTLCAHLLTSTQSVMFLTGLHKHTHACMGCVGLMLDLRYLPPAAPKGCQAHVRRHGAAGTWQLSLTA